MHREVNSLHIVITALDNILLHGISATGGLILGTVK